MTSSAKPAELIEHSLERLAEARGDITAEAMARYYRRWPGARASFERHGLGDRAALEASMVAETVFALLQWSSDPATAKISQGATIVHHHDILEIPLGWYVGLFDAVIELALECAQARAPEAFEAKRAAFMALRDQIAAFMRALESEFVRARFDEDEIPAPPGV